MEDTGLELSEAYDLILKTIIIGEASCGKTCLIHHFLRNQYKDNSAHTIGVEFSSRTVRVGDKNVKLQVSALHPRRVEREASEMNRGKWSKGGG